MTPRPARKTAAALAALDRKIAGLIQRRATLVVAAPGAGKAARFVANAPGPLGPQALRDICNEIGSATAALAEPQTIAFMGPAGSFTHQAALKHFGSASTCRAADSIGEVFRLVAKGEADFGVVPVENSNEGMVSYTLDMFVDAGVTICAEVYLDIHQNLLSKTTLGKVRKVYSMPMVWGQCRTWLATHLPHAAQADVYSTARAAELAAREPRTAAIGSTLAADIFTLDILARAIEDFTRNITRFLVIGAHPAPRSARSKTSIMFSVKHHAGALYGALKPFRDAGINLTKIESRPSKLKAWEYYFFVDLLGHEADPVVARALGRLATHCNFVRVLGSYPNATPCSGRPT